MELKLKRTDESDEGIFGEILDYKGRVVAFTAEHAYNSAPKLPVGTYKCVRGMHALSNGKPFETFEVTNVPGHTGILIHPGNWPQVDSHGCILVGQAIVQSRQGRMVTDSKRTFEDIMKLLAGLKDFTLTVF